MSELQIALPPSLTVSREAFESFLSNLHSCQEPIAFELIGTAQKIVAQFASHPQDMPSLRRQLIAYFPEAGFVPAEGTVGAFGEGNDYSAIVEFGLGREFLHPLASGKIDSLVGLTGALSELRDGESALCQVIFEPCRNPWAETVRRLVSDSSGKPLFVNRPEFVHLAEAKISKPLYAVVLRVAAESDTVENVWEILRNLAGALCVFAHPNGNEFIPLRNDDYAFEDHIKDLRKRQTRRSGMLLNVDELVGLVHLPSAAVKLGKFIRQTTNTKVAPRLVTHSDGVMLGSLLMAKFQQTAMSRQRQAAAIRRDFWIYLDEFQNFISPSLGEILTGARKYRIGLVLRQKP